MNTNTHTSHIIVSKTKLCLISKTYYHLLVSTYIYWLTWAVRSDIGTRPSTTSLYSLGAGALKTHNPETEVVHALQWPFSGTSYVSTPISMTVTADEVVASPTCNTNQLRRLTYQISSNLVQESACIQGLQTDTTYEVCLFPIYSTFLINLI